MAYRNFNFYTRPYPLSKHRKALQWSVFSRNWYLFDCKWQDVFDAAQKISMYLQGKHKPIYDWMQDIGDHVVCINTSQLSLPNDEWRYRMYYHHTRFAPRGRRWAGAYELHINDPTLVLYKACYKVCGAAPKAELRRLFMNKLHLYPEGIETVPKEIRENIVDQIRGVNPVYHKLSDFSQEEIDKFPKIADYPDEYVIPKV